MLFHRRLGPSVDPQLVRFSADAAARSRRTVDDALPLIAIDGAVRSTGLYPSRDDLASWAGVTPPAPSLLTDQVDELVAIGTAIGANCDPCLKFHYNKALTLGVSRDDMRRAVGIAQTVKDAPAKSSSELAARLLRPESESIAPTASRATLFSGRQ